MLSINGLSGDWKLMNMEMFSGCCFSHERLKAKMFKSQIHDRIGKCDRVHYECLESQETFN